MRLLDLFETIAEPDRTSVRWAMGKHQSKATPLSQRDQGKNVLVTANIEDIFNAVDSSQHLDLSDPMGGPNRIGNRVPKAKAHWNGGGHMDPSLLGVRNGRVYFEDGRHRLVAAYQLGHKYAPVLVPDQDLKAFKKLVRVKDRVRPPRQTSGGDRFKVLGEAQAFDMRLSKYDDEDMTIWKNPSQRDLIRMVQSFHEGHVRGFATPTEFYVWEAYRATHREVIEAMVEQSVVSFNSYDEIQSCFISPKSVAAFTEWSPNGIAFQRGDTKIFKTKYFKIAIALRGRPMFPMIERAIGKLTEAKRERITVHTYGRPLEIAVMVNPTMKEIANLRTRFPNSRFALRGLTTETDLYVWEAYAAHHFQVSEALGGSSHVSQALIFITREGNKDTEWTGEAAGEKLVHRNGLRIVWTGKPTPQLERFIGPEPITEAKSEMIPTYRDHETRVWYNPSWKELNLLVEKFGIVRAISTPKQFVAWNAKDEIHTNVEVALGMDVPDCVQWMISRGQEQFWMGVTPKRKDDIRIWASYDTGWKHQSAKRAFDLALTEAMLTKVHAFNGNAVRAWVNPSLKETQTLVAKYRHMRATASRTQFVLWDANRSVLHNDVDSELQIMRAVHFYLSPENVPPQGEMWNGTPDTINGMWVMTNYDEGLEYPSVKRSLGTEEFIRGLRESVQRVFDHRLGHEFAVYVNPVREQMAHLKNQRALRMWVTPDTLYVWNRDDRDHMSVAAELQINPREAVPMQVERGYGPYVTDTMTLHHATRNDVFRQIIEANPYFKRSFPGEYDLPFRESAEILKSVPTKSPEELAKKFGRPLKAILKQLEMGIRVEMEHTNNPKLAREIALDHLGELPDYYSRLKKMEAN